MKQYRYSRDFYDDEQGEFIINGMWCDDKREALESMRDIVLKSERINIDTVIGDISYITREKRK